MSYIKSLVNKKGHRNGLIKENQLCYLIDYKREFDGTMSAYAQGEKENHIILKEGEYTKMNVIASCSLTYFHSLNIYDVIHGINDCVMVGVNDDKPKKYRLYYNTKGTYFNYNGSRYYMDEFMRIAI